MRKEDLLAPSGTIIKKLPKGIFRMKLEDDREITATLNGKLRRFRFLPVVGDRMIVEMTRYDTTKRQINYWHR